MYVLYNNYLLIYANIPVVEWFRIALPATYLHTLSPFWLLTASPILHGTVSYPLIQLSY